MVLARVVIEQAQVIEGECHRSELRVCGVPLIVADGVDALQVIAERNGTYRHAGIVGKQKHFLALGEKLYDATHYGGVGKGCMMALAAYAFYAQTVLALHGEDEAFGQAGSGIEIHEVVREVGLLVVHGVLHGSKAVYLLVGLAHNDKLAATMAHHLGYEVKLALKHQARIASVVAVRNGVKLKPHICVADNYVIIKDTRKDLLKHEVSLMNLLKRQLLYLLIAEDEVLLRSVDKIYYIHWSYCFYVNGVVMVSQPLRQFGLKRHVAVLLWRVALVLVAAHFE